MLKVRSAGAIIFYIDKKEIKYLILEYRQKHWDFPRGHVEKGESDKDTARREIKEETGLKDFEFIPGFQEKTSWFYKERNGEKVYKEAIYFLARSFTEKIKLSHEHTNSKWLIYDKVLGQLTFGNAKNVFKKAYQHLIKYYKDYAG